MLNKGALAASVAAAKVYVEDVFSTWLYTGNGSTQTITNEIDLSGKGGLVWTKPRASATFNDHIWVDSARGDFQIQSNSTAANSAIASFNFASNGYTVPSNLRVNESSINYTSWTFRKAAKFFDVVTYTGTGANRTIAHSLGSVPGTIIVKRTDTTGDWQVYHRSLANTEYLVLNATAAKATGTTRWNSTTPTSTAFSLGTDITVNASGGTYVAYLFAHDAGGFGDSGNESIIKCGSFTTDGSGDATVDLGWEPQWVLIKNTSASENWNLVDTMRGFVNNGRGFDDNVLSPNLNSAEATGFRFGYPTATGFFVYEQFSSNNYIYIAIRRGPMKTPTDATKVFSAVSRSGTGATATVTAPGFAPDMVLCKGTANIYQHIVVDKLRGISRLLQTAVTSAENTTTTAGLTAFSMSGFNLGADNTGSLSGTINESGKTYANWVFRRAPGFFDVVAYTGTGVTRTVNHNLSVVPTLIITKQRDAVRNWFVHTTAIDGSTDYLLLNTTGAKGDYAVTAPTSSVYTVINDSDTNASGGTYIAYLFASLTGISKVGSYTGTGTTLSIDCGFTAGARLVLIKRTDSTGNWYIWDSARGIVSGNDPYLLLNSTAAEVTNTDYIDPLSSGFQISSTAPAEINASGGSYIFLAVA